MTRWLLCYRQMLSLARIDPTSLIDRCIAEPLILLPGLYVPLGVYSGVHRYSSPSSFCSCLNSVLANCLLLSLTTLQGQRCQRHTSFIVPQIAHAVAFLMVRNSIDLKLEKGSWVTSRWVLSAFDLGNGPTRSVDTIFHDCVTLVACMVPAGCFCCVLKRWQLFQLRTNLAASRIFVK